jgi:hypothetical protein
VCTYDDDKTPDQPNLKESTKDHPDFDVEKLNIELRPQQEVIL